jgi:DNA-binding MarR family transcriptional regulator
MTAPAEPRADELWPHAFGAWIKVAVCYQKGHRRLSTMLRPLDLTVAQFDALANLYGLEAISQQELAERLLVTKGNVTGLLHRLLERGLVRRRQDPDDRRANRISLTAAGAALAREGLLVQRSLIEHMMGGLSSAEQQAMRELLARVVARLDARAGDE